MGESSLPRQDEGGVLAETARGIATMKFCCEALRICAVGGVEVRYACWLLVTSLGNGVAAWMPCGVR